MFDKLIYKGSVENMTDKDTNRALKFINKCRYCVLGTINEEYGINLSILTTQEKQELKELWFFTPVSTQKVVDITRNPKCELLYTDNDNQINIRGEAFIVKEVMLKKMMWNTWVNIYLPEGPESDESALIKFIPNHIHSIIK